MSDPVNAYQRTRIKVCGISRIEDARACVAAGVDALGFVFYEKSPRSVTLAQADTVMRQLPAFITTVALFLDPQPEVVAGILDRLPVDLLQFHGVESAAFCEQFKRPYIKAVGMAGKPDLQARAALHPSARALLVDSHAEGAAGGTGKTFDWAALPDTGGIPVILAGGLKPGNVADGIRTFRPYAVDVSSGVEVTPGIKDPVRIREFVAQVRRADSEKHVN